MLPKKKKLNTFKIIACNPRNAKSNRNFGVIIINSILYHEHRKSKIF